jgi:outer membrane protein assembly factor BamD
MTVPASGRSPLRIAVLAAATAALGLTAGCAGAGKTKKDVAYVARDVDTLYMTAKDRLNHGDAKQAAALFDEVERQHPYSPWARRAQLMGAFSYYVARDYAKSVQTAQRFLSIHPGNKDAPYAYYLVALCYYEQISDVTRDQKITQQALTALTEVMRRYPNTDYATDARMKIDLVNDHLAGKEMEVGRFYERSGKWLASACASAWWSTSTRPRATRPRRCSVWSKPIWRSAFPRKRTAPPPCWATTIRAANGTSARSSW